ncbi:hypothetical protein JF66_01595 [Cryobacterium sp. MLB-32]|uniref:hypothetical protein n=1 Tax=Cryobacterium sp. MLB-32 TaxID=1529318 RepID=UPI0004E605A1|nr:hypothetical protein [Cryobacterium sp. MLB-32]KFF60830.1 hypothetical protein JF66_01595 [Cryobacterium sp. MLB-32]
MPSYRITLTVGDLRDGVTPDSVVPTAARAAAEMATVEASELAVVSGEARVIVRFSAENPAEALRVGLHVRQATADVARLLGAQVTERVRSRWLPVL